jgi:hypothetical protein
VRDALAWDRVMLRNDLRLYIRQAWHVIEPSTVYLENWHIDLIAEHLEAVTLGQIKRLLRRTLDHLADQGVDARARRQIRYNAETRPHRHFLRILCHHQSHNAMCRRFRATVRHPRADDRRATLSR